MYEAFLFDEELNMENLQEAIGNYDIKVLLLFEL
jgi:hypothetical protein